MTTRKRLKPGRRTSLIAAYLLTALLLLCALSLVAIHPEQDKALVVGLVMLTVAAAVWLPLPLLVPVVVLIWAVPTSIRDSVGEGNVSWSQSAALGAQIVLGIASYTAYRMLRHSLREARPQQGPRLHVVGPLPSPPGPVLTNHEEAKAEWPVELPCGRRLSATEALSLMERLAGLDRQLNVTEEMLRTSFHRDASQYQRTGA